MSDVFLLRSKNPLSKFGYHVTILRKITILRIYCFWSNAIFLKIMMWQCIYGMFFSPFLPPSLHLLPRTQKVHSGKRY